MKIQPFSILTTALTVVLCGVLLNQPTLLAAPQENEDAAESPSHVAKSVDGPWLKHAAEGSNAEIMMPAKPRYSQRRFRPVADEPFITVKTWLCTAKGGEVLFAISYHDLYEYPQSPRQQQKVLEGAVRGAIAQVVGSSDGATNARLRSYPGRKFTYDFTLNGQELRSDAEVYLIGRRQFMLSTIFKQQKYDPELSKRYFDTFNPFDPEDAPVEDSRGNDGNDDAEQPDFGLEGFSLPNGELPAELK